MGGSGSGRDWHDGWRSHLRGWAVAAVGLALVVIGLGRAGGAVDAQDVLVASPVSEVIVATETPTVNVPADEPADPLSPEPSATPSPTGGSLLTGETLPSSEPESTATPEPIPAASPESAAPPTGAEAIRIEVRSTDGTVGPGGSVAYHFRVTNSSSSTVRFHLIAGVDRPDWTVNVVDAGSTTSLVQPVALGPGQARAVSVIVIAPVDAVAGEQTTLSLNALDA